MAAPEVAPAEPSSTPKAQSSTSVFATAGAIAAVVAALVVTLSASDALVLLGIPDPGPATIYGLPAVRAAGEIAASIAIGSFLLAAFLVPPQKNGVLDVGGYRAVRTGSIAAIVWAACAVVLVPLTLSDTSGQPFLVALQPDNLWVALDQVEIASAWRWTAILAVLLAIASRAVLRWSWTPLLLVFALGTVMPIAVTGHSSSGGSHDVATNSLILHLVAATLWAGGLFAVLAHARRAGAHTDVAARRFSAVATVCFVVMGVSGVINALVRVSVSDLFTTTYGLLVVGKIVALIVLGFFGWIQRRRSLPALVADPQSRGALVRFAGGEVLIFAATIGLAVGLGRTPPPANIDPNLSLTEAALGYDLDGPPTFARLALDWRFDLIFGTASIVLAVVYLLGVRRLRRRGDTWPMGRTAAFLLGCLTMLIGTSSGVGKYSPAVFSVHMGGHMALSMLAPVLLALGGALTLALRALPAAGKDGIPGPREWLLQALHSPVSRFLTHPIVAAALFVGGFYALYLGGIFDAILDNHSAHLLMNAHFILSGYLFYWVVIGVDPSPRRIEPITKLAMVFGSLPFHAFFGVALMSMNTVLGGWYYRTLGLDWNGDLIGDQRLGGGIAWATGEIPLVLVMLALLIQWSRSDDRNAKRVDRAAERDHDADLAAHNAMFAELARRDREAGL
ncbi:bifunctional copper resistance protein CopD/cytochrome c oxidase assembly protein [Rhodococcus sp. BP-252]|uniref:cytochrome c oxidase assembly protein n=1 Tax=unclassified Rhodococcus (in: high G+C Gram-positive bacteria) TaxID=192944 RepID=UPI0014304A2A|nr:MULTISPECIES: cytochrome c oxidase assembly protein [unclassified Rhodococcus (in: high G+C Gram-positive bacteria)]MBY6412127.1 bifunctional copper resistance protein CopD/cytochrome c oxidase assembly protein [Rhodococcus sp. BP-320]MBY6416707.1 bifunctional copper resistance protein CopD/cytochrome c oxidase assembly protein [Rhodococcus sp. BP-321]MBY6421104.1 bifunctional copper resistance protein CopD/cytochrome c oxidase assembly protein [Rhodococcus sp. BP-324]MBY6426731.1 bifunction